MPDPDEKPKPRRKLEFGIDRPPALRRELAEVESRAAQLRRLLDIAVEHRTARH